MAFDAEKTKNECVDWIRAFFEEAGFRIFREIIAIHGLNVRVISHFTYFSVLHLLSLSEVCLMDLVWKSRIKTKFKNKNKKRLTLSNGCFILLMQRTDVHQLAGRSRSRGLSSYGFRKLPVF